MVYLEFVFNKYYENQVVNLLSSCSGNCIMEVWDHGSAIQPCKCPLCRRQITLLVPGEASLRRHHDPEVAEILRKVEAYNRLFGGRSNGLIQVIMCAHVYVCIKPFRCASKLFLLRTCLLERCF